MMRASKFVLSFLLMAGLGLMGSAAGPEAPDGDDSSEVWAQGSQQSAGAGLPDVPPTPPSDGERKPGGSLNGNQPNGPSCLGTQPPLTALTPENVAGYTLSDQPTFWFYMPYTPGEILKGEFSLMTKEETQRLYRTSFELPETPGWVSISWPDSADVNLAEGEYYHWYVNLYCTGNETTKPDLKINGWVLRLARTPEREQQIEAASDVIWYDAIALLAGQLQGDSPAPTTLQQDWAELLESVKLGDLASVPVVGPVEVMEE